MKRANEILLAASSPSWSGSSTGACRGSCLFIDDHRSRFGLEFGGALATASVACSPAFARSVRDAELIEQVFFNCKKGRGISEDRKIRRLLARDGLQVARCCTERLMRRQDLR